MGNFYFSIETTGLNPEEDKILAIQFQELDRTTGGPIGELQIFKEWESSEKEILKQFFKKSKILEDYPFNFVPVGYNLGFERKFIKQRAFLHQLPGMDLLDKPFIDLRALGILMNQGEFKGSGLDNLTGKEKIEGRQIPVWYNNGEFNKIIGYIKEKAKQFIEFNSWLYKKMPELIEQFKKEK